MWKRLLVILGIVVALGSVYWWFDGARMKPVLESYYMGLKNPELRQVPKEFKEPWMARQAMTKFRYSGYEFEIPWDYAPEKSTDIVGNKVVFHFSSGNDISFAVMPAGKLVSKVLSLADEEGIFPQVLGEQVLESDYPLTWRILQTTPGKVSLLSTRTEAITVRNLLLLKQKELPSDGTGLFMYKFRGYRCFQFGNPEARPRSFSVNLYSDANTLSLEFTQPPDATAAPLSQADVDSIVRSVHKVGGAG
jgi:hypothetical protein